MVVAFGGVPKFARWPGLIGMALNWFGSLRDSSSNFDSQKNFVFFVFFVEKNRTLISDLTQSNFKVLLITLAEKHLGCQNNLIALFWPMNL